MKFNLENLAKMGKKAALGLGVATALAVPAIFENKAKGEVIFTAKSYEYNEVTEEIGKLTNEWDPEKRYLVKYWIDARNDTNEVVGIDCFLRKTDGITLVRLEGPGALGYQEDFFKGYDMNLNRVENGSIQRFISGVRGPAEKEGSTGYYWYRPNDSRISQEKITLSFPKAYSRNVSGQQLETSVKDLDIYVIPKELRTGSIVFLNMKEGIPHVHASSVPEKKYKLQGTTNLVDWIDLTTGQVGKPIDFIHENAASAQSWFYRSLPVQE